MEDYPLTAAGKQAHGGGFGHKSWLRGEVFHLDMIIVLLSSLCFSSVWGQFMNHLNCTCFPIQNRRGEKVRGRATVASLISVHGVWIAFHTKVQNFGSTIKMLKDFSVIFLCQLGICDEQTAKHTSLASSPYGRSNYARLLKPTRLWETQE